MNNRSKQTKPTSVVTGAAGFLGSHLTDLLLSRGHKVIGIDNFVTGSVDNIAHLGGNPNFKFIQQDVTEFIFLDVPVNYVWHFASPASPIDYLELPIQTLKVGSLGTHKALGLAKNKKARFLIASTSEIYGDPLVHPQTEDYWGNVNPIGPRGCYDEAKRFAEALTMAYHKEHAVETRIVRIFNTYGPRMRLNDGRVVPAFISQALKNKPLTVFGDGRQTRSFCYVSDLIEGIYRLMMSAHNEPVNIGNPREMTMLEFAKEILQATGSRSKIVFKRLPQDDPRQRQPNITRARSKKMLNSKSFLAVDFGAVNLKIAEFEINDSGGLLLKQYGLKSLGQEGTQEVTREAAMTRALQELLSEMPFGSKIINLCAPGFHTFSKFVKLPPVDTSKVTQIIQYEAQQNVPFPLEEVVWDYQILGATATGELEVLLVAIKSDIVEGLFKTAESAGLRLQLVDVSPAALCNAFRYNYGDLEGCTMLLDIGAKTSNLLFFEKGKVYSRGINIGANSITQDFAAESKMRFAEAEKVKIAEGFVSLGGAYEEPDNPHQAAIAKIARQVMTRLHIQVNQTIQFYRGQQGGSQPTRLFLAGGGSIMPYTAQFFAEKLNVPVEYFNPFRNIQIDPAVNLEELARVAHSMGEVVGLGLRNLAHCPVELNLMPESTRKWRDFNEKKPYLIATVFTMVAVVAVLGVLFSQLSSVKAAKITAIE